jgi:hypothetical protein
LNKQRQSVILYLKELPLFVRRLVHLWVQHRPTQAVLDYLLLVFTRVIIVMIKFIRPIRSAKVIMHITSLPGSDQSAKRQFQETVYQNIPEKDSVVAVF